MKIYVEVKTPGNGKSYEFEADNKMIVGKVKEKMIDEILEAESLNITLNPEKTFLCNLDTGLMLSEKDNLRAAGVKSGQQLMLL